MTDYGPPSPPPPLPYPDQPTAPAARPGLLEQLGARVVRRPEPRFGVALAAVGVILVISGVLAWAGEYASSGSGGEGPLGTGGGRSDSHKILGIVLSLVVVAVGYAAAILRRTGPLTNAGVAASALGVPVLMGFLSYDPSSPGSGLPLSTDAIAVVSMLVWVASYLVVPVVRGHIFYIGATLLTLWLYLLDKIEPHLFSLQWVFPFAFVDNADSSSDGFDFPTFAPPDFNTVAGVCLLFGLGYYVVALVLDSTGRSGLGVAFALVGFLATASGIAAAAVNLAQAGAGVLLIVLGIGIGAYGARHARRFTTWLACGAIGFGIVLILAKIIPDNATEAGISLIVIGTLLVALAPMWSRLLNEPDETVVRPRP
jgi:hypothetical protein